jgi:pyruvate ferredoxin oxidoreductase alpha subunit
MTQDEIIWRIAGGSGDGIDSNGQAFATGLMRSGLNVFTHRHYPSRIRGGHTFVEVRAAAEEVKSRGDGYNVLLALGDSFARNETEEAYYGNEEVKPLAENLDDLREGGIIIYDEGLIDPSDVENFEERAEENSWHVYPMDLRGMAREMGREIMRNQAGIGVTCAAIGMDLEPFRELTRQNFESKGQETIDQNIEILERAHEQAQEQFDLDNGIEIPEGEHEEEQVLVSGSRAIAYGALDEGCRFIAGYPMTPWTDAFKIMSSLMPEIGGVAEQVEDEIAAAAMAVGASHAGVKAMSGSSGGGFALMSEPLGLAEMTETPLVLLEAQRAGPSTGMPTKPEQGDLEHALFTSQGDSHRVAFAPANIKECYDQARHAFQVAYDYQIPTLIVYDQKLSGEYRNLPASFFDREVSPDLGATLTEEEIEEAAHSATGKFNRFQHDPGNEAGVSPRSIPGQKGGRFLATGNEHIPSGHISEDPNNRVKQVDRRSKKLGAIREDLDSREGTHQTPYGEAEDAEYGILTWGSNQGTVEEAVDRLTDDGYSVKALGVSDLEPFPEAEVREFIESVDEVLVVEMNASGQFRGHVQRHLGQYGEKLTSLLKYNGNPFEPAEIVEGVEIQLNGETGTPSAQTRLEPATGD